MTAALACKSCGGQVRDERQTKKSPKAPDGHCMTCDEPVWRIKSAPAPGRAVTPADAPSVFTPRTAPQSAPAGQGGGAPVSLGRCYVECLDFAIAKVVPRFARAGVPLDAQALASVVATLYIARCQGRR